MKISVQPFEQGAAAYVLCDGADRSIGKLCGPQGLRINGRRAVQEEDLFRAIEGAQFDRGNKRTVVSFGVSVHFATQEDADAWLWAHAAELPGQGTITAEAGSGGPTRSLQGTIVSSDGGTVGVSVRVQYEIRGGAVSTESGPAQ